MTHAQNHLWSHVLWTARHGEGAHARQQSDGTAEVAEADVAVVGEEHVARVEITEYESELVKRFNGETELVEEEGAELGGEAAWVVEAGEDRVEKALERATGGEL
eukprot:CAMPEP_0175960060 /NCGR_PEP_ID=MMETSP0108-20121206/35152_1 /TAXON_ID=195067 ORGANISM="Goniomonas pacifica, Strain CCMP1869" /NCGR_SAMPLE_ID=MMETSP0108 /ASSEMBLY_ACC=CAM_ASM_000204 /LENGTH=104 /DNA_ID=CAMNT_0017287601 /DNA_START=155 /DNA_END=469 /DNA_ORIENTATION=-